MLDEALARLQAQAPLPEGRREAIEAELEQIKALIGAEGAKWSACTKGALSSEEESRYDPFISTMLALL